MSNDNDREPGGCAMFFLVFIILALWGISTSIDALTAQAKRIADQMETRS